MYGGNPFIKYTYISEHYDVHSKYIFGQLYLKLKFKERNHQWKYCANSNRAGGLTYGIGAQSRNTC